MLLLYLRSKIIQDCALNAEVDKPTVLFHLIRTGSRHKVKISSLKPAM